MIYPQIVNYIKSSLAKNIPVPEIKKSLVGKGWRESDVSEAIALVEQSSETKPTESKINQSNQPNKSKPSVKIPSSTIFIIVGVLVLIFVIGLVIYFVMNSTPTISNDEIFQGATVDLGEGKEVKFNINEEEHRMVVNSVTEDTASITVYSTPLSRTLTIGQTEKFDINSDFVYDLSIKLNSITNQKADFFVQEINEAICTEEWECTNWTSCADSVQLRNCTDLNECGTEESKPDEAQECIAEIELSCSDKNGTVCESYEECDGTLDGDCCLENCTRIATTPCGTDIDCLINASDTCHPANMTDLVSSTNSTIEKITYYYNIEGLEEEGRCKFYTGIKNITGNFTADQWATFRLTIATDVEVEELLNDIHDGIIATTRNCIFSPSDLEDYLTKIKTEDYQLTATELTAYECTGNLYEE